MPHHVFNRGNNKRRLFSYPNDYKRMLWDIENALDDVVGVVLYALALMTNHFHLVVVPESAQALSDFMKRFAQKYAVYRNGRRKSSGKLFEERYQCKPILSEEQLAITTAYVELNPVRAFMVAAPHDYPWSTHRLHLGDEHSSQIPHRILTPSPWYLGLAADPVKRASLYSAFVEHCRARDVKPDQIEYIEQKEREAEEPYSRRLERPNRQRACESSEPYGRPWR